MKRKQSETDAQRDKRLWNWPPDFKSGDKVEIDWSKVGLNNGNFSRGYVGPLEYLYTTRPFNSVVRDARGVIDIVASAVLRKARE